MLIRLTTLGNSYLTANSIFLIALAVKSLASLKSFPLRVWVWPSLCTGALPLNPTRPNRGDSFSFFNSLSRCWTKSGKRAATDFILFPSLHTKTTSTLRLGACFHVVFLSWTTSLTSQDAVDVRATKVSYRTNFSLHYHCIGLSWQVRRIEKIINSRIWYW